MYIVLNINILNIFADIITNDNICYLRLSVIILLLPYAWTNMTSSRNSEPAVSAGFSKCANTNSIVRFMPWNKSKWCSSTLAKKTMLWIKYDCSPPLILPISSPTNLHSSNNLIVLYASSWSTLTVEI